MSKDELYEKIKEILINDFEVDETLIKPEARIADDIDLDSIDAVEMIVKARPLLKGSVDPSVFKMTKTVQDVVDVLYPLTK
ncbi:MAG: acyl carrier protein [Treponema sp.]|nr:acyl carrier protein [Treponema sp.]